MPIDIRVLVETHFAFIARSVRRLGVPETDVEDAAQQVFLIAAQKLDRVVTGNEKAFLLGIAVRVASEARRSLRRRTARETAAAGTSEAVSTTPEEIARARQARALLDEILDGMPDDLRPVFTLFELEEMTMVEIATLLGIPSGSVASRLRRAREIFHAEAAKRR
ncbi:MAG TPA: sigma-70 family RNA polymerase sigma factor [Polyangia bacterium]